jgi:DNA-binding IclR family transcriptional regulator
MSKPLFSEELRAFIKNRIQTVLRLEILLLLHDKQPRSFNAAEVAEELSFETEATQEQLSALEEIGLAVQSPIGESRYRYHPADETLRSAVKQLAAAYSTQRVPVLSVILADASHRSRLFAEAFRIIRRND